ncbi:hypothetical protein HOD29_03470 [archaeon]|nr:hypothetical protein [archaeon]
MVLNKLISGIKKGVLYATLPVALTLGSCTVNKYYIDDAYYYPEEDKELIVMIPEKDTLEAKTIIYQEAEEIYDDDISYTNLILKFNRPFNYYSSSMLHSGFDRDWDGIDDWNDPWPWEYGPYVDMNNNGFIDWADINISNNYWSHNHWHWNSHNHFHHWGGYWDSPWIYKKNNKGRWAMDYSKKERDKIYGHRNTSITDGVSAKRIYGRSDLKDDNKSVRRYNPKATTKTNSATRKYDPKSTTRTNSVTRKYDPKATNKSTTRTIKSPYTRTSSKTIDRKVILPKRSTSSSRSSTSNSRNNSSAIKRSTTSSSRNSSSINRSSTSRSSNATRSSSSVSRSSNSGSKSSATKSSSSSSRSGGGSSSSRVRK